MVHEWLDFYFPQLVGVFSDFLYLNKTNLHSKKKADEYFSPSLFVVVVAVVPIIFSEMNANAEQ
jgi:hypothetical protein